MFSLHCDGFIAQNMSAFPSLATELVVHILELLDWKSLITCRLLSGRLRGIVDESILLQYKIDRAVAGVEDGPTLARWEVLDKAFALKRRQKAWHDFKFETDECIPMLQGVSLASRTSDLSIPELSWNCLRDYGSYSGTFCLKLNLAKDDSNSLSFLLSQEVYQSEHGT